MGINQIEHQSQRSVLASLLFIIYIIAFDCAITSVISEFADATIIELLRPDNTLIIQKKLTYLNEWTNKWMMMFDIDRCSILSLGKNNPLNNFTLNNKSSLSL